MRKLILSIFLFLFLINSVNAQPPFTGQTTEEQIVVDALIFGSIKQNQDFTLHVHAFNASTGRNLTNATTGCAFHLYNSSGSHILRVNFMSFSDGEWDTVINKNNFTKTGSYALVTWCFNGAATGGSSRLYFEVTPNGEMLDTSKAITFSLGILLLLASATFFFCMSYIIRIDGLKIAFMSLTVLHIIILIGLITSNSSIWIYAFNEYNSFMSSYYVGLTIISIGLGFALIIWLVYYAFTMFYKSKNLVPED